MASRYRSKFLPYVTFALFVALIYCLLDRRLNKVENKTFRDSSANQILRDAPVIFVGGFPRSGTTLMRVVFDAHPDVRCGQETRIVPRIIGSAKTWTKSKIEVKRLENAGINSTLIDEAVTAFISEIIVGHGAPARRYCNKDPFVMSSAEYVSRLYKNAKFIYMIRDGRAAIHSAIKRNVTITGYDLKNFTQCLSKWNTSAGNMWKQCKLIGPTKCLPVWYEMMVQNPKAVISKVLKFLELPWDDAVIHHQDFVGKDGGIRVSETEKSSDQVSKAIYKGALKSFVGHVPFVVESSLETVAPMIEVFGYDTSPDPDYSRIRVFDEYKDIYSDDP